MCKYFKQFNSEQEKIEDNLVKFWESVLTSEYDVPKSSYSNKVHNGKKWDIPNFDSGKSVFITKNDAPKSDGRSKLHIQRQGHILFTANQLPIVYNKVCILSNAK